MTENEDRTEEFTRRLSKVLSEGEREALMRDMAEDLRKHRVKLMEDLRKHQAELFPEPVVKADLSGPPHGRGFRNIEEDYHRMVAERRPWDYMPDLRAMRREREAREK